MNPDRLLGEIRSRKDYAGQILHVRESPARAATFADTPPELRDTVRALLDRLGISRLYSHQAEAVAAVLAGDHVCTVSGTASGKTLTYLLPIVNALHERGTSRALLMYPTKALAQDQLRKLTDFGAGTLRQESTADEGLAFTAETYDGDTPSYRRRLIKRDAQVVLTNPDMLHVGILPYHHTWSEFFRNLKYVVLDEVHTYRGIFGSHTANVIRRLRRVAAHYGADPKFICCSATIGNPDELAARLTGLPMRVVRDDGAPRGRKLIVFWNPPVVEKLTGKRRSGNLEAADLLATLVRRQIRNITFTLARSQAELILRYAREHLEEDHLDDKIMAYRGGYLPAERREIERRLFTGELLGVAATTALELGVDIGGLEAVIMAGYPGTISSAWQQMGRAGRGQEDSLAVLVGLSGALHQYVVNNPEYLLDAASERAVIDPENPFILAAHLLCAAYELPIDDDEGSLFGDKTPQVLDILSEGGYIARRTRWYWLDPEIYPAREVSIRSASGTAYDIVTEKGDLLGTMDGSSAQRMIHKGAIYLHGGQTYLVQELDLETKIARVKPADVNYYTQPLVNSEVRQVEPGERKQLFPDLPPPAPAPAEPAPSEGEPPAPEPPQDGVLLELGPVSVRTRVVGFQKVRQTSEKTIGSEELDLPTEEYETMGLWLLPSLSALQAAPASEASGCRAGARTPPAVVTDHSSGVAQAPALQQTIDIPGSLHAIEHVLIMLLPLFVACDAHDVGGISTALHPDVGGPAICLYDGYPGGVGLAEAAFDRVPELMAAAAQTIRNCLCEAGCPACVQQSTCGSMNRPLDKCGALLLLDSWLQRLA
ncbi:MAG: DEAD/DEAH box helicase [Armatimonadia bacterium]